jgi:hypothetical protein
MSTGRKGPTPHQIRSGMTFQMKVPAFIQEMKDKVGYQDPEKALDQKRQATDEGRERPVDLDDGPTIVVLDEKKDLNAEQAISVISSGGRIIGSEDIKAVLLPKQDSVHDDRPIFRKPPTTTTKKEARKRSIISAPERSDSAKKSKSVLSFGHDEE